MQMNRGNEVVAGKECHVVDGSRDTDGNGTSVESERILVCADSPRGLGWDTRYMRGCWGEHSIEGLS